MGLWLRLSLSLRPVGKNPCTMMLVLHSLYRSIQEGEGQLVEAAILDLLPQPCPGKALCHGISKAASMPHCDHTVLALHLATPCKNNALARHLSAA